MINVTQVYKYLREYDKHTAKQGRPFLYFPFFQTEEAYCIVKYNLNVK